MAVFGDLNAAMIIGNITNDIEVRHTPNGNPVTSFTVATNRRVKQGDEWQDETTFHNIVVWGNDAEYMGTKARKGTRVYISGRLQTRNWQDQNGITKYKTEIVAERVILLDRYERSSNNDKSLNTEKPQNNENQNKKVEDTIDPDDLPF